MSSSRCLRSLTDAALVEQLRELVRRDHQHTARLLRYLDEVDRRQLWARFGHPSMFDFCVTKLGMSESEAGKRIGAARTARRFPLLFEMVAKGEIHLSGIHRLKAHLTEANHCQVLAEARHKTIKELELLVARLSPQPDVPSRIRALPNRRNPTKNTGMQTKAGSPKQEETSLFGDRPDGAVPAPKAPPRSPDPKPLSPRRYKLEVTLDEEARGELEQLQGLLAHQVPDGDPAAIVKRALTVLLEQTMKKKAASTERPRSRAPKASRQTRTVPAAIRRAVWTRDQGRCAFVGEDGRRCGAKSKLEFAHVRAWGKGGEHSVENIGLRCRAHNDFEAVRDYGEAFMANKRRSRGGDTVREEVVRYEPAHSSSLRTSHVATWPAARSRAPRSPHGKRRPTGRRGPSAVAPGTGRSPVEARGSGP